MIMSAVLEHLSIQDTTTQDIRFGSFLMILLVGARGLIIVEALRLCELGFEESPLSSVAHAIVSLTTMGFMYLLPPSRSIPRTPLSLQLFFSLKRRLRSRIPTRIAVNRVCQKVEAKFSAVLESAHLHMISLDKSLLYFLWGWGSRRLIENAFLFTYS